MKKFITLCMRFYFMGCALLPVCLHAQNCPSEYENKNFSKQIKKDYGTEIISVNACKQMKGSEIIQKVFFTIHNNTNDQLNIWLRFGIECKDAHIEYVSEDSMLKTLPPKEEISGMGDNADAELYKEINQDVSPDENKIDDITLEIFSIYKVVDGNEILIQQKIIGSYPVQEGFVAKKEVQNDPEKELKEEPKKETEVDKHKKTVETPPAMQNENQRSVTPSLTAELPVKNHLRDLFGGRADLTFLGLDFTQAKFIPAYSFPYSDALKNFIPSWNTLITTESEKYSLEKPLRIQSGRYSNSVDHHIALNKKIDLSTKMADMGGYSVSEEQVIKAVMQYNLEGKSGIGISFIVESFDKNALQATVWVTFIDMSSGMILLSEKISGKPEGIGIRNFWARAVFEIERSIKKEFYEKWLKESQSSSVENYWSNKYNEVKSKTITEGQLQK